jgi:nicotinamide mononucleotide transporter
MEELNYTLLTLWGYPLSVLELVGVLTGFAAVFFASKAWAVNFLFGLVNAVAYFLLYFQYHLYSVMLLQIVYFSFSIYGYYHWKHPKAGEADGKQEQRIGMLNWRVRLLWIVGILVIGAGWGWAVIHLQARFPHYFAPPAFPWLDAILTMGSVVAQYLLSRKIWENWILWIVLDSFSTVLYAYLGMVFTSVLFATFTIIALKAVFEWKKIYEAYE